MAWHVERLAPDRHARLQNFTEMIVKNNFNISATAWRKLYTSQ